MEIQIEMPNKKAIDNFMKWFRKEGFESFTKSKFNKLIPDNTDSYITCLATDEKLETHGGQYVGHFLVLE